MSRDSLISAVEPSARFDSEHDQVGPSSPSLNASALLWRGRGVLAKVTLRGTLLALTIALLIPSSYESTTRLMTPDIRAGGAEMALVAGLLGKTNGGGGIASLASDLLGTGSAGAMFIGVLRSRTVADSLVQQFDLKKVYWVRRDTDAREKLAARSDFAEDRKSQIITITVSDHNPKRAADLARAYVDQLNRLLAEVNTSAAHRQRVFIDQRLAEVKVQLHEAAVRLSEFSSKNTTIDPKEQGKAMVGALVTLQGERIALQTQLRGLEQVYTDDNVRVRSTKARIAELQNQIEKLHGANSQVLDEPTESSQAPYPTFRALPGLGVTFEDLYREVKLREAVFEALTVQDEMAKIEEVKEIPVAKVLDAADIPQRKSGPPRLALTILGMLLSFAGGVTYVLGRRLWIAMDSEDPRKRFALEVWQDTRPLYSRWQKRWRGATRRFSPGSPDSGV